MLFSHDDIAQHSAGLDEVQAFCIRTVCETLNEMQERGVSFVKPWHREPLMPLLERARAEGGGNIPRDSLLAAWPSVNAIRTDGQGKRKVTPEEQQKMAERLEACLPSFEHTRKGVFARGLLEAASDRMWTRAEYNQAQQYVLEVEHPDD